MNPWSLKAGETIPSDFELGPISRTDVVRYQGASGDFQPIHHDEGFARTAGYDAPLVIGMYPAAAITTWAAELFGPTTVRETRIRWNAMVWPGDTLKGQGSIRSSEDGARWVDLVMTRQNDETVLTCAMHFVRDSESSRRVGHD